MKKLLAIILAALLMTGAAAAIAEDYTFGTDTAFRPFEYTDETGSLPGRPEGRHDCRRFHHGKAQK